jgi:fatty-acyl-CoA synthase
VHRINPDRHDRTILDPATGREHCFIADSAVAISRGSPLADEPGLGDLTLGGFLREVTARSGTREALVQRRHDGTRECWRYDELWQQSLKVARALVACGIGKGERVGVLMTNSGEFLAAVFGAALAGAVASPLSTFATPRELEQLVHDSACSVLLFERHIGSKDFARMLYELEPSIATAEHGKLASRRFPFLRYVAAFGDGELKGAIESSDRFLARGDEASPAFVEARSRDVAPSDPGVLFFSSGSTGRPKGILSAHRAVTVQLWRMRRQQGLAQDVRYWTANGFFWSGNFAMAAGATLAAGGTLILQRLFQPEKSLALLQTEDVNFPFAWPHQSAQLQAAANWSQVNLSSLRYVDPESPLARHPTVHAEWLEPRYCYGNTETFTLTTGYPAGTSREQARGSHGLPLPGNSIKIVEPLSGRPVTVGARGEIAVKGPTLMLGYLGKSTDETLDEEGYFRTGDGGYLDTDGRLFWEGRLNDIIKSGGANVSPIEIDEIISSCPGVKLSQTVGVPHETLGELIVTCIVLHENARLDEGAIRAYARERLASYKVPRRILFFPEQALQLTGSAKVKTAELRQLAARELAGESDERRN